MNQYTSYWLYQKYEQRGTQEPIPVYPNTYSVNADGTMPPVVRREYDEQCGWYCNPPVYQWVDMPITEGFICEECPDEPGTETILRWTQTENTVCSYEDPTPYESMYFTIIPKTNGNISINATAPHCFIYYSVDNTYEWISPIRGISMEVGHIYKFKAVIEKYYDRSNPVCKIIQNTNYFYFDVEGNIMSLGYGDNFEGNTSGFSYSAMFENCIGLISAKNLILPPLVDNDYSYMFKNCGLLKEPPTLPNANSNYIGMFASCVSLEQAPVIPTGALKCSEMFYNCQSLVTVPSLPETSLSNYCYKDMFRACTSLKVAPSLPSTTLAIGCYENMFYDCVSLEQAPELPATTAIGYCYRDMFVACTSLVEAPELPATVLGDFCYYGMFSGCTSLAQAPQVLPATTLATGCYAGMFTACVSLKQAPELPAPGDAERCYQAMFWGCTSLNYIKCLHSLGFDDWSNITKVWTYDVSPTGTFIKASTATNWSSGKSGIPYGWTVQDA